MQWKVEETAADTKDQVRCCLIPADCTGPLLHDALDQAAVKLRKRVFGAKEGPQVVPLDGDSQERADMAPQVDLSRSPLRWFGVLTPPELQEAQQHFGSGESPSPRRDVPLLQETES